MDAQDRQALDEILQRRGTSLWPPLAATAWRNYLDHGRGVMFGPVGFLHGRRPEMDYVTVSDGSRFPDWLENALAEYDPQTSVVVLLADDDEFDRLSRDAGPGLEAHVGQLALAQVYCRTLTMEPAPPDAYRRQAS